MMNNKEIQENSGIRKFFLEHQLPLFFVFAFAITWGIAASVLLFMPIYIEAWGPVNLENPNYRALWMIAVYSPAISAITVISIAYGKQGLRAYLKRLLNWRFKILGIVILISVFVMAIFANFIYLAIGGTPKPIEQPWYLIILFCLFCLIYDPGPMEELGWRGLALPELQKRYSALWSSIILGFIWGIWHIPAFYISALSQSSFSLPIFIIETTSLAIIMTVAYNKGSKGSIPLAFLIHWAVNLSGLFYNIADVRFFLIQTILFTCLAVLLIILFGHENLGDEKYTNAVPLNKE